MPRRTLSRAQMHALVWERPVRTIAEELGLSDVGLKKICKRHAVPTPPRGYWARVQAGQRLRRAPLPALKDARLETIQFMSCESSLPEAAREDIEKLLNERVVEKTAPLPDTPRHLHQALIATAAKLRSAKSDRAGAVTAKGEGLCGLHCRAEDAERLVAILNTLFHGFEARGVTVEPRGETMAARSDRDEITFRLSAKLETQQYIPNEAERAAEEQRLRRAEREKRLNGYVSWDTPSRAYPETHQVPNGKYSISIEAWTHGLRSTWSDGKRQTLEKVLGDIVIGIEACLLATKAQREENERREQEYEALKRKRALYARWRDREEKRLAFMKRLMDFNSEATRLEAWLSQARAPDETTPEGYARLLAWAQGRLALVRRQSDPEAVANALEDGALFPETDELAEGAPDD